MIEPEKTTEMHLKNYIEMTEAEEQSAKDWDRIFDLAKSFYDQVTDGDGYTHTKSDIKNLVEVGFIEFDEKGYCKTTDKLHAIL